MKDPTDRLAKRLRRLLEPGELVLVAVPMNQLGTMSAALGGIARATDVVPTVERDHEGDDIRERHRALGIDGVRFHLVLTDQRLVLVRRNALGMAAGVTLTVPIMEVESIGVTARSMHVPVELTDGRRIELETPKALKHLPSVYREIPSRLEAARRRVG